MESTANGPDLRVIEQDGAAVRSLEAARCRHPSAQGPRLRLVASAADLDRQDNWSDLTDSAAAEQVVRDAQANPEAIVEYDGFPGLDPGEPDDADYLTALAAGLSEHGEAYRHWAQLVASTEQLQRFDEAYLGLAPNRDLWHEHLADALGVTDQLEAVRSDLRPFVSVSLEAWADGLRESGAVIGCDGQEGLHLYLAPEPL